VLLELPTQAAAEAVQDFQAVLLAAQAVQAS
jgi:hypothetical protein